MDPFDEANKLSAGARPRFLDPQCRFEGNCLNGGIFAGRGRAQNS